MARSRTPTLSSLGRSPARVSQPVPKVPVPPVPTPEEPPPDRGLATSWLRAAFLENVGLKFLSLVLSVTVFLLVNTDRDREITARVGVAYSLPDDKVLVSDRVDELRVTIKGPWRKLRGFDERELDRVTLDLRRQVGPEITITPDMINVPSGMTVTSITPRTLRVTFERRLEKIVEVQPALIGRPAHGFVVAEVTADPKTVRVKGAESVLRGLVSVRTREISLDGRSDTFKLDTEIVPPEGIESVGSQPIRLQIHLDEELVSRKITSLTIIPKGVGVDPSKWIVSPPQVDITLTGALLSVEKAKDAMSPVVKVLEVDPKGRDAAVVVIENLPPGVGVKVSPERVKIAPAVLNPRP